MPEPYCTEEVVSDLGFRGRALGFATHDETLEGEGVLTPLPLFGDVALNCTVGGVILSAKLRSSPTVPPRLSRTASPVVKSTRF